MKTFITSLALSLRQILMLSPVESAYPWVGIAIATACGMALGFLLIGLPGAVLMVGMRYVFENVGIPTARQSEATWAIAILVTLAMPLALPLAHLLAKTVLPRSFFTLLATTFVWFVLLGAFGAVTPGK